MPTWSAWRRYVRARRTARPSCQMLRARLTSTRPPEGASTHTEQLRSHLGRLHDGVRRSPWPGRSARPAGIADSSWVVWWRVIKSGSSRWPVPQVKPRTSSEGSRLLTTRGFPYAATARVTARGMIASCWPSSRTRLRRLRPRQRAPAGGQRGPGRALRQRLAFRELAKLSAVRLPSAGRSPAAPVHGERRQERGAAVGPRSPDGCGSEQERSLGKEKRCDQVRCGHDGTRTRDLHRVMVAL